MLQYFRGYEVPSTMRNLWRYLRDAYDTPAFSETLPIDDDLCKFHWVRFPDTTLAEFRKQGIKGTTLLITYANYMNSLLYDMNKMVMNNLLCNYSAAAG